MAMLENDRFFRFMDGHRQGNQMRKYLTSRIALHIYFWLFVLGFFCFASFGKDGSWNPNPKIALHVFATTFLPVYAHFYLFEKFFYTRRYLLYALLLLLVVVINGYFASMLWESSSMGRGVSLLSVSVTTCIFIAGTTGLKLLRKDIRNRMQLQELKAKQLQTELHLLKSQINPHFLFNTLNNLFGMARKQDPGTADGIAHLSHLMRYMIYDGTVEKIELDKEVEQIQRIVELQRLRFSSSDPIQMEFTTEGDLQSFRVPPMILIPFVENAFKHGIEFNIPSFVRIHLTVLEHQMEFSVENSVHRAPTEPGSHNGIGLQNVKRQLEILYPGTHELRIDQEPRKYTIHLTIHRTP
jgi:sensor histidine kinase YesM